MKNNYNPQPIDTAGIEIPSSLAPLLESMAEHVHDVWAMQRFSSGWTWGPSRDDAKMTNPCLVSYDELPETEKEYDRNTAMETLKYILSQGYDIKQSE